MAHVPFDTPGFVLVFILPPGRDIHEINHSRAYYGSISSDYSRLFFCRYLNAAYNGWVQTSMERDKSILTISAGAIGLLITLLNVYGPASEIELLVYLAAMFFFMITILCAVFIFSRNKHYLENVIKNNSESDGQLEMLDKSIMYCFMTGIVLTAIIGANAGVIQYKKRSVENESQRRRTIERGGTVVLVPSKSKPTTASVDKLGGLNPGLLPKPSAGQGDRRPKKK